MQLAVRVGPIVALTRFHVINSEVSYHVLDKWIGDGIVRPSIVSRPLIKEE